MARRVTSLFMLMVMMKVGLVIVAIENLPPGTECIPVLTELEPCLPFVQYAERKPTSDCCSVLKDVHEKSSKCLCRLITAEKNQPPTPGINLTLAFLLPAACDMEVNPSRCPGLLGEGDPLPPPTAPLQDSQSHSNVAASSSSALSSSWWSWSQMPLFFLFLRAYYYYTHSVVDGIVMMEEARPTSSTCKQCGKARNRDDAVRGAATVIESLVQVISRACQERCSTMASPFEQLQMFWKKPIPLDAGAMLASTSALSAMPISTEAQKSAAADSNEKSERPSWVKDPPALTLAVADEIGQRAAVGWSGFMRPVDKVWEISSGFGPRWGRHHNGVDLAAPSGEPVIAADAGEVSYAGWEPGGYGYLVEITHRDGWKTLYAHNSEIYTWEGQQVRRGQCIASVGESGRATGPHLHWEIRNQNGNPVDPSQYLDL